jgi:hypothetical protein
MEAGQTVVGQPSPSLGNEAMKLPTRFLSAFWWRHVETVKGPSVAWWTIEYDIGE